MIDLKLSQYFVKMIINKTNYMLTGVFSFWNVFFKNKNLLL